MRWLLLLTALISLGPSSGSSDGQARFLKPAGPFNGEVRFLRNVKFTQPESKTGLNLDNSTLGLLDTLSWRTLDETNMIFGFLTYGDTAAMWFDPLGPCTLKAIRIYSVDFEGNIHIDVWKARYDGHIVTEDSVDAYGWIGMHEEGEWGRGRPWATPPWGITSGE